MIFIITQRAIKFSFSLNLQFQTVFFKSKLINPSLCIFYGCLPVIKKLFQLQIVQNLKLKIENMMYIRQLCFCILKLSYVHIWTHTHFFLLDLLRICLSNVRIMQMKYVKCRAVSILIQNNIFNRLNVA